MCKNLIFKVTIGFSFDFMKNIFQFIKKPNFLWINSWFRPEFKWQDKKMEVKVEIKSLCPRKPFFRVMQSIYSPNRFYITFRHDDSWNFVQILHSIKKIMFIINNINIFLADLNELFFLNYVKSVFATVN